ncbi:MAG: hypothetical protein GW760_02160 [Legionella sp.]|nr:hypothetical protein [Legionella sp.]
MDSKTDAHVLKSYSEEDLKVLDDAIPVDLLNTVELDSSSDSIQGDTPIGLDAPRDEWLDELIDLAVDLYLKHETMVLYESAFYEENIKGLTAKSVARTRDAHNESYFKYTSTYSTFSRLFIDPFKSERKVKKESMQYFDDFGEKHDVAGFRLNLIQIFRTKFHYGMEHEPIRNESILTRTNASSKLVGSVGMFSPDERKKSIKIIYHHSKETSNEKSESDESLSAST